MTDETRAIWNFKSTIPTTTGDDLVGYTVVALDGGIGKEWVVRQQ